MYVSACETDLFCKAKITTFTTVFCCYSVISKISTSTKAGKAASQVQVQAPTLFLEQQQQQQQQMLCFGNLLNSMYQKFQCNQSALNLSFTQPGHGQPTAQPGALAFQNGLQNNTAQPGQLALQNGLQTNTAQPAALALQNGFQNNTAQPGQLSLQNFQQPAAASAVAQGVASAGLQLPLQNPPAEQTVGPEPEEAEQQNETGASLQAFEENTFKKLQKKQVQAKAKAKAKAKALAKVKAKAQAKAKAKGQAKCKAAAKAKSKASSSKLGCLKCRGFSCEVCSRAGFTGTRLTREEWLERAQQQGLK